VTACLNSSSPWAARPHRASTPTCSSCPSRPSPIFYFIILLPTKQKQKKLEAFLEALKVGDRVVTTGGIYGQVTKVNEASVQLQVANNVRIEVAKASIGGYQGQETLAEGNS